MTGILKKGKFGHRDGPTQKEKAVKPHREHVICRQRIKDPSIGQGTPKLSGKHQKLRRDKEVFLYRSQREHGLAETLILHSYLPNKFVVLGHTVSGILLWNPEKQSIS